MSDLSALLEKVKADPRAAWTPAGAAAGYTLVRVSPSPSVEALWRAMQDDALFTPFQSLAWCRSWIAEPAIVPEPVILVGLQDGEPELLFPLVRTRRLGLPVIEWLAQHRNDYNAPLMRGAARHLDRKAAGAVLDTAVRCVPGTAFAFLASQPRTIEGHANPFAIWRAEPFSTSAHSLSLAGGWPAAYERSHGESTRRNEAKKLKRLRRDGPVTFRRVRGEELDPGMVRALRWKREQLHARGAADPFADGLTAKVLDGLAAAAGGARPLVRLYALESNARPFAYSICLAGIDSQNQYITIYDPAFTVPCSPGTQLTNKLTELFARAGYSIFDFSAGDEPYKLKVCDTTTGLTFAVRPLSPLGVPAGLVAAAIVHLRRWAKAQPAIFEGLHKARRLLRQHRAPAGAPLHDAEQRP